MISARLHALLVSFALILMGTLLFPQSQGLAQSGATSYPPESQDSVASGSGSSWVANVSVGLDQNGGTYDPGNHEAYFSNLFTDNISAISTSTIRAIAGIPLPSYADHMEYDPNYSEIWANTLQTASLQAISDATDKVIANVTSGCAACPFVIDLRTGNLYQSEYGIMAIVSPAVSSIVDTFPVPGQGPGPIA